MTDERLQGLLQYRLEQAQQTLAEASVLRDSGLFRGDVNRAYYSMFYATLALLATRKLGTSKHSNVIALFDREFVKTGLMPKQYSRSLHRAFEQRQVHDYGELIVLDEEATNEIIQAAAVYVEASRAFLVANGYSSSL